MHDRASISCNLSVRVRHALAPLPRSRLDGPPSLVEAHGPRPGARSRPRPASPPLRAVAVVVSRRQLDGGVVPDVAAAGPSMFPVRGRRRRAGHVIGRVVAVVALVRATLGGHGHVRRASLAAVWIRRCRSVALTRVRLHPRVRRCASRRSGRRGSGHVVASGSGARCSPSAVCT